MNADEAVMLQMIDDVQDAEELALNAHRRWNQRKDPFTVNEQQFLDMYRVDKETAREIIDLLDPLLNDPTRSSALNKTTKVLIALNFFSHGSYQSITGRNLYSDCSQSSVSKCITEVSEAFNNPEVLQRFIKFPRNMEKLRETKARFANKYGFSGIVGVIDCTHVSIVAPKDEENIYVNRKNYHSINVQLVCDESLKIMHCDARFPGSTHDSFIWRQSNISDVMERIYRNNNHEQFFLIGDSGYPLRPWLITPLENPEEGTPEYRFNAAFKSIRSSVERCNGVLKNRFRCLLKDRTLHYSPEKANKIINACAVLHNICISKNIPEPDYENEALYLEDERNQNNINMNDIHGRVNLDLAAGRLRRNQLIARFVYP